jgi:hypothetical protein
MSQGEQTGAIDPFFHLDRAFAEPMARTDEAANHDATQVLAKAFKAAGFGDVAYNSAFGEDGFNFALFDLNVAEVHCCGLLEVKAIAADFRQATDYVVYPAGVRDVQAL